MKFSDIWKDGNTFFRKKTPHDLVNVGCKISAVLLSLEYVGSKILFHGIKHVAWWRLLRLFSWYLFMLSSLYNSLNDRATVDAIYMRPIFTWIGQQWPPRWLAISPLIIIIVYNVKLQQGMWVTRSHDCDKKCQQSVFEMKSIYITFHIASFHFDLKEYFTIKIWYDNPRLICVTWIVDRLNVCTIKGRVMNHYLPHVN